MFCPLFPPRTLSEIRSLVESASGQRYNFVLVNRYSDGRHCIGEHRDDEKELSGGAPIASLSLGAERDFYFKHADARSGRDRHGTGNGGQCAIMQCCS